ncbi:hypothetical protein [Thiolapillus brandeum]|uniref:Uncharacterized protein n=1 Tax=Thiolapillus brandeum TaxID=1076588 RepID=A0A7U6GGU0_9GAMM|nr:hypothetical protein [Thiolapillus brandeum]BAO43385.1 conserved hypothetical protein [Thiolapillus brandeum]
MADILPFRKPRASDKHRGKTLCRHNHHQWKIDKKTVFDNKRGCLVTRFHCLRCGKVKTRPL